MAIIGISILIASLSFLFYRHPPSSWPFFARRRICNQDGSHASQVVEGEMTPSSGEDCEKVEEEDWEKTKAQIDRKAMPPPLRPKSLPPLSFRVHSAQTPPQVEPEINPTRASSLVTEVAPFSTPPLSFPAINSIQRASGSRNPQGLRRTSTLPTALGSPDYGAPSTRRSSLLSSRSPAASSSLLPPPTHAAIPPRASKRVLLSPGHSPLDWAYLTSLPNANLRGLPQSTPYLKVPPSLLSKHTGRKGKNAWTVLGGKVYNITPYLPYHPGGEQELMRAAGRDGTKLFAEVHPWVNWEGMLETCLVGIAIAEDESRAQTELENLD